MGRQKGCIKPGGRQKGSRNKRRIFVAERLAELNFCVVQNIICLFEDPETPPDIRCKLLSMLLDYSAPKPVFQVQDNDESYTEEDASKAEAILHGR